MAYLLQRKISLLAIALLTAMTVSAQQYSVHKVTGNVSLISGKKITKITQNATVSSESCLRIGADSEIWLRERKTRGTVYKLRSATGNKGSDVKALIAKAKNHAQASIIKINKKILDGISVNKTRNDKFQRAGVSRIVTNASGSQTTLASLIGPDEIDRAGHDPVSVKKVDDGDRLYHFSMKSNVPGELYANIILKDCKPDEIEPMFPECVLLADGQNVNMDNCQFYVPDMPFAGFILILCDSPFSTDDIISELDAATQNINRTYIYQVIR